MKFSRYATSPEESIWTCEDCGHPEGAEWLEDSNDPHGDLECYECGATSEEDEE